MSLVSIERLSFLDISVAVCLHSTSTAQSTSSVFSYDAVAMLLYYVLSAHVVLAVSMFGMFFIQVAVDKLKDTLLMWISSGLFLLCIDDASVNE